MTPPLASTRPPHPALVPAVRGVSVFLLILSAVMLPLLAGTATDAVRLLVLLLGMAGAFFHLLTLIFERRAILPALPLCLAGAAVLVAGFFSALRSDCPGAALETLLTWLGYAAIFLLAFWTGLDHERKRRVVRALCALALPIAVYGLLQYAVLLDVTRAQIQADKPAALRQTGLSEREYDALLQRTISKRVFSTFALSNSLAAFLILLLPPAVALAASAPTPARKSILAAAVLIMLLGLFFTFSKGGWLVAAVLLAVFLAMRGRRWLALRWRPIVAAAAALVVLLAGALALSPYLRSRMSAMAREAAASRRVRTQYWSAALAMWRSSTFLGVGPGNFKNHYTVYKSITAEETKNAHNDYVQLLAECGPLALAGYLAFWPILLIAARRRPSTSSGRSELAEDRPADADVRSLSGLPAPASLIAAAALCAIAAASILARPLAVTQNTAVNLAAVVAFAALWLLAYWAAGRTAPDTQSDRGLSTALLIGVLGFALHSFVDLDLYVDGVASIAFIAAGLAAAGLRTRALALDGPRQLVALAVVTVLGLGTFYIASRVSEAGSYRAYAVSLIRHAPPSAATDAEAHAALERACRLNPLDHESFAVLAQASFRSFCHPPAFVPQPADREPQWSLNRSFAEFSRRASFRDAVPASFDAAVDAWRTARALNPSFGDYAAQFAWLLGVVAPSRPELVLRLAADYRPAAARLGLPSPPPDAYIPALAEAHRATELAPTNPEYHFLYGQLLERANFAAQAKARFRTALDLHESMVRDRAPRRQWLPPDDLKLLAEKLAERPADKLGLTPAAGGAIIPK